jgi:hypothetical protein
MRTKLFTLIGAASIALLAGCATRPVTLSPVGPEMPNHDATAGRGFLQVYSDTESPVLGEGPPYYYPHMGYNIYTRSGVRVRYVPNHIGDMDETPTLVRIPAGTYYVVAESSAYGRVTVPVVIEGGRRTVLHLDRSWRPIPGVRSNDLVQLPDGEAVGWAGATAKSSP